MPESYDLDRLHAFVEDELSDDERAAYERTLAEDAGLRELADDLRRDRAVLRGLPDEPAPEGLLPAATRRVERDMLLGEPDPGGARLASRAAPREAVRHAWTRRIAYGGVAAAVLVAAGLTWYAITGGVGSNPYEAWAERRIAATEESGSPAPQADAPTELSAGPFARAESVDVDAERPALAQETPEPAAFEGESLALADDRRERARFDDVARGEAKDARAAESPAVGPRSLAAGRDAASAVDAATPPALPGVAASPATRETATAEAASRPSLVPFDRLLAARVDARPPVATLFVRGEDAERMLRELPGRVQTGQPSAPGDGAAGGIEEPTGDGSSRFLFRGGVDAVTGSIESVGLKVARVAANPAGPARPRARSGLAEADALGDGRADAAPVGVDWLGLLLDELPIPPAEPVAGANDVVEVIVEPAAEAAGRDAPPADSP